MREVVRKKLNSRRGASIFIALLLFLVCAALGSVILAAATAASGRASAMVVNDRRYYAVTSAAELFRDALDGQGMTVTRTKEYAYDAFWTDTNPTKGKANEVTAYVLKLGDAALSSSFSYDGVDLLTTASLDYVLGVNWQLAVDEERLTHTPGSGCNWAAEKTITVTPLGDDAVPVKATVSMKNGVMTLTFVNDDGSGEYRLSFTLTPSYELLMEPQTYTVEGEQTVSVTSTGTGTAGDPIVQTTNFSQHVTEYTNNSVHVTWRASVIESGAEA